jgi:hypothetical protein
MGFFVSEPVPLLGTVVYGSPSAAAAADRLDFVDSVIALPAAVRRHEADVTSGKSGPIEDTIEVFDTGEPLPAAIAAAVGDAMPSSGLKSDGVVAYPAILTAAEAVALSEDPRLIRVTRRTLDMATRNRQSVWGWIPEPEGCIQYWGALGSSLHVVSIGNQESGRSKRVEPPANAKNVLSIGTTVTYNPSPYNPNGADPISAKNWTGDPRYFATDVGNYGLDLRRKPDLLAPGTRSYGKTSPAGCNDCNCTIAGGNFSWGPGTSFSAPIATGAAALVREWRSCFLTVQYYLTPSPALTKAILIAAAIDLYVPGVPGQPHSPSPDYGWGGLSLEPLFGSESGYFF